MVYQWYGDGDDDHDDDDNDDGDDDDDDAIQIAFECNRITPNFHRTPLQKFDVNNC